MHEKYTPHVGKLIEDHAAARRDAIHVAVLPAMCGQEFLYPGQHVKIDPKSMTATRCEPGEATGIVDPFLTDEVHQGQWFWLFIMPNTITSLRHAWTHPHLGRIPTMEDR